MATNNIEKVLRVGVIYNGKILDEEIFRKPETIYIGDSSKSHFVIPTSSLPSKFPIFYFRSGKYELVIIEKMTGKVFLKGKVIDIDEVVKKGMLKKRGNAYILPLSQDARGKVVVGSAVVLFQFITPPPRPPKLKLPRSIKGSWTGNLNWPFVGILLACYVLGSGVIAYMWTFPPPAPVTLETMDKRFAKMIAPKIEDEKPKEKKEIDDPNAKGDKVAKKKSEESEAVEEKKVAKKSDVPRDAATRQKEEAMRVSEMKKKVAGVGLLKLIGTVGEGNSGAGIISDVLGEGGKDRDIDSALSGVKQIGIATDSGQRSRKGEAGATETAKIDDLKVAKSSGNVAVGGMKEKAVTATTKIGAPEIEGSKADQASISKVVKSNGTAIQRCYEKALKANPQLKGKISVTWMINEQGRVQMVEINEDTMGEASVSACIKSVIMRWRFPPPEAPASVTFPFAFIPGN